MPQTTTTLAATSAGTSATTVSSGSVVSLKASVTVAGVPVTAGQVKFCDASTPYCSDIHWLATAQLTSAGTAAFKFVPGIGSHSYKAVFLGRSGGASPVAGSSSSVTTITVTGKFPTTTSIASSGNIGDYSLTATVSGIVNSSTTVAPTGSVSFLDTTNSNFLLGTAPLGTAAAGLSFFNSSNPATVSEPNVVAAADFNGDGIPDLAVSNSNSGGVLLTILLGKGDGTFTATPTSPTVGLYPDSVVVGDFNGDGISDLALTSVDENIVTILLGNGDGTFRAAPNLNTDTIPQSVATGDFNGDGIADLAVVNGDSVLIFLGNGDGTFTASVSSSPTGMSPITVATGDFNGDGIPDLAVVNSCGNGYPCSANGTVTVLLGKGDGTFTTVSATPVAGPSATGLVVADFNGDGILDLAVSNYGNDADSAVTVFLGNGDGTFKTGVNQAQGFEPDQIVVGDFNDDGIPDLVIASHWSGIITMLPGKGDGTFGAPLVANAHAPLSSGYVAMADFNGDGTPDLAIPNQDVSGTAAILLTQPTQTATASISPISPMGTGAHLVDASYPGDDSYNASTSTATSLTAQPLATMLNLSASPTSSSYGQQVMLTATLTPSSGQNHSTTGETISFYSGSLAIGSGLLSSGVATLNLTSLPIGTNSLKGSFGGDTNFAATSSAAVPYSVAKAVPTVSLTVTPNPAVLQSSVTLTATVSSSISQPTGSVLFSDGSTALGTVVLSSGTATLTIATLAAGSHSLTATYGGDTHFILLTSAPVSEVIENFSLNAGGTVLSQTAEPGGTASYTIPVNPVGASTFESAISFTASGLPAGATATFSPQTITAGSGPTKVVLTIQVANQLTMVDPAIKHIHGEALMALSLLVLPFWGSRRRFVARWRRFVCLMVLLSGVALLSGLTGCGTSGGGGSTNPSPQTYNITITATSGAVSQTAIVKLNVQ